MTRVPAVDADTPMRVPVTDDAEVDAVALSPEEDPRSRPPDE